MQSALSSSYIVGKAEDYFYFEDDFAEQLHVWALGHCNGFASKNPRDEEQPLEHQEIFTQYCGKFESILEKFLKSEGVDIREFYVAVRDEFEKAKQKKQEGSTFAAVLLSAVDFFSFCEMMHDVKEGRGVVFCPPLVDCPEEEEEEEEREEDYEEYARGDVSPLAKNSVSSNNSSSLSFKAHAEDKDEVALKEGLREERGDEKAEAKEYLREDGGGKEECSAGSKK